MSEHRGQGRKIGKKINFGLMTPHKKHLIYQILNIYRECGYLRIYKIIHDDDLGYIGKHSEWQLEEHLRRLKSGKAAWMFTFRDKSEPPYIPLDLREENQVAAPVKRPKVFKQLAFITLSLLLLFGCIAQDPITARYHYLNNKMAYMTFEQRVAFLDSIGETAHQSDAIIPSHRYFWEGPLYKSATNIQQTISVGVANSRYYRGRRR